MKIGVLTFWWGKDNYGQLLQCFALQRYLELCGHNPFVVRYLPGKSFRSFLGGIIRALRHPFPSNAWVREIIRPQRRACPEFLRTHCRLSERTYSSLSELRKKTPEGDCFICGSDQVWNCGDDANGQVWFLDWVPKNKRKFSYAASIGRFRKKPGMLHFYKRMLESFQGIGVRENDAKELLNSIDGVSAERVCDPTLLLPVAVYSELAGGKSEFSGQAFCYWLGRMNPNDVLPTDEIAPLLKSWNIRLKNVYAGCRFPIPNLGSTVSLTIPEWLAAIRDAKIFFTNSFHGTVFSLIFHTPFVVFPQLSGEGNDRFISLLKTCGLENRIHDSKTNRVEEIVKREIDWDDVDARFSEFAKTSKEFLSNCLS